MQASCAGGKKRLRPPSISQEIKNIQLIEQLPYIANSWDIPGTPVQGNNLPNIDGAKLTIPFSISLSLNTNNNNVDKETKNTENSDIKGPLINSVNKETKNAENSDIKGLLINSLDKEIKSTEKIDCSTNKGLVNNEINSVNNIIENESGTNNTQTIEGPSIESNNIKETKSESILLSSDKKLANLDGKSTINKVDTENQNKEKTEIQNNENITCQNTEIHDLQAGQSLQSNSEQKSKLNINTSSTDSLYPKVCVNEIKNVTETLPLDDNDLSNLFNENPLMEDTPEYDINETDLLTEITGLSREEIKAEIDRIDLSSDTDSDTDMSDLDSGDFSLNEDEANPPSISVSGLDKIFEGFEYNGNKTVEEHLNGLNQTIAKIDLDLKQNTGEKTEVQTIYTGSIYLETLEDQDRINNGPRESDETSRSLSDFDKSESSIKIKSHYKNALNCESRAKIAKAVSFISYLHDFPSQNKFMAILLVLLTTLILGHSLAPIGLLALILFYVNIPNGRQFLLYLAERRTDIIDMDKLEKPITIKTIKSNLGVLDKIQIPMAINGNKIIFELDTGASVNCVSENLLLKVLPNYHEMELCSAYRLSSVEGKPINVIDARRLGCEFEGVGKVFLDFHILKEKNICLLGRPFLVTCNISMQVKGERVFIELNPNRRQIKNPYAVNLHKLDIAQGETKLVEMEVKNKNSNEHFIPHLSNHNHQIKLKYKVYNIRKEGKDQIAVYVENIGNKPLVLHEGGFVISLIPFQPENKTQIKIKGFEAPKMGSIKSIAIVGKNTGIKEQLNKINKNSSIFSRLGKYFIKPILNKVKNTFRYIKKYSMNIVKYIVDKIPFKIVRKN